MEMEGVEKRKEKKKMPRQIEAKEGDNKDEIMDLHGGNQKLITGEGGRRDGMKGDSR